MPITFKIAAHDANEVKIYGSEGRIAPDPQYVVAQVWRSDGWKCKEMLQSSYRSDESFMSDSNGFVNAVVRAYNEHYNLVIRPDDLWTSILSQMNFYVNAHAEELRSKFVAHQGKKELKVTAFGTRYSVDFGRMARSMGSLLKDNIADPSLHDWITPNYSTTTPNDVVVCSVMMMSTLKAYFSYSFGICCGIPSITLLGKKKDYLSILKRIDRLAEFGEQPRFFARLLQPILKEFCKAFDSVAGGRVPNPDFWSRICHYEDQGSGPTYLSGWISAFIPFGKEGQWQGGDLNEIEKPVEQSRSRGSPPLVLAGLRYPVIDTEDIPNGFCDVDVKLDDNGEIFDCKMVAGHVGYMISAQKEKMDTLQPSSQWFMFIKEETETEAQASARIYAELDAKYGLLKS